MLIGKESAACDHPVDVPGPGRRRRRGRAGRRSRAAAEQRRHAGHQRIVDLLRADHVDMRIEAAGGEDLAFAGDHFGAGPDDDRHARLNVGIAGLADRGDAAFLQRDIGFDDAPMIEHDDIGDDGIDGAVSVGDLALAHAVADDLAAAELHLVAVDCEILLDFEHEIGVGEPHAVAVSSGRTCRHRRRAGTL